MPLKGKEKATDLKTKVDVDEASVEKTNDDSSSSKSEPVDKELEPVIKSSNGENHSEQAVKKEELIEPEVVSEEAEPKNKRKTKKEDASEKTEANKEQEDEEEEEVAKRPTRGSKRKQKSDEDDEPSPKQTKLSSNKASKSASFACDKNTPDGRCANLKISSWNVAGLRAWVKKDGSLDYVIHQEQPDMMVLLETKCSDSKLPPEVKIPDYQMYSVASEKEGYCGVLLYTKIKPLSVQYGIGNKEFDNEGRCIIAEYKDFYLICAYVPNAGQGLKTLQKKLKWNIEFLKLLKNLDEKKPVILCGDLNVAHEAIDLANPKTNTKNAGFTKEEREDFTKLLSEGFVDTFRHFNPDQTGAYTFWTNRGGARSRNVGWRLDYFVVSERFLPNICDSLIRPQILGSDHCPVTLCLHVSM